MLYETSRRRQLMSFDLIRAGIGAVFCLILTLGACANAQGSDKSAAQEKSAAVTSVVAPPVAALSPSERKGYLDAASLAWKYFERNTQPATGLTSATPNWANTTLWDIGAQIIATYSARELGLITPGVYAKRVGKILQTMEKAPLYRGVVYNRVYSTTTGGIGPAIGWSSTDMGRFLAALKLLAVRDPQFAAQAERIARRSDFGKIVFDGYLHGQLVHPNGKPFTFQEGRIGYEQYAATGFKQWGAPVGNALNFRKNGEPINVLGVNVLADRRYNDRLLSEPFILLGLEFGLDAPMRDLARSVLAAQEQRFKTTGQMTIVSEDAVSEPPDYFYYYCVLCNRKPFVVDLASPGKERDHPRWVSTKAAYGWDAIMPSDYTKRAVQSVAGAMDPKQGWASGIYESSGKSTKTIDINTSAVMLEIALFKLRGSHPLIEDAHVQLR